MKYTESIFFAIKEPLLKEVAFKFNYRNLLISLHPKEFICKFINELSYAVGMQVPNINFYDDNKFNTLYKHSKLSEFGAIFGGTEAIKAGYRINTNTIELRESAFKDLKNTNTCRLFINTILHELGHAYHSQVLKITKVNKNIDYEHLWVEDFANAFSVPLEYNFVVAIYYNYPEKAPSPILAKKALTHNYKNHLVNNIKELIEELE